MVGWTGWKRQTHERALAFEAQGSGVVYHGEAVPLLDVAELVRASARGAGEHQEHEA